MEQLRQVARGFGILFFCLVSTTVNVAAQNVCSLTVRALAPDGRRGRFWVTVKEENGHKEEKMQGNEDVQFCDLGILPVTVTVGNAGTCNQVTIHDVPVSWERPYLLKVTYDPQACDIWEQVPPPVPLCELLFRVSDAKGNWLSGASLKLSNPRPGTVKLVGKLETDRYGRAHLIAARGDSVVGSVSANGFRSEEFDFVCSEKWQEHSLRLERGK